MEQLADRVALDDSWRLPRDPQLPVGAEPGRRTIATRPTAPTAWAKGLEALLVPVPPVAATTLPALRDATCATDVAGAVAARRARGTGTGRSRGRTPAAAPVASAVTTGTAESEVVPVTRPAGAPITPDAVLATGCPHEPGGRACAEPRRSSQIPAATAPDLIREARALAVAVDGEVRTCPATATATPRPLPPLPRGRGAVPSSAPDLDPEHRHTCGHGEAARPGRGDLERADQAVSARRDVIRPAVHRTPGRTHRSRQAGDRRGGPHRRAEHGTTTQDLSTRQRRRPLEVWCPLERVHGAPSGRGLPTRSLVARLPQLEPHRPQSRQDGHLDRRGDGSADGVHAGCTHPTRRLTRLAPRPAPRPPGRTPRRGRRRPARRRAPAHRSTRARAVGPTPGAPGRSRTSSPPPAAPPSPG